jgi:hypothetical protein
MAYRHARASSRRDGKGIDGMLFVAGDADFELGIPINKDFAPPHLPIPSRIALFCIPVESAFPSSPPSTRDGLPRMNSPCHCTSRTG